MKQLFFLFALLLLVISCDLFINPDTKQNPEPFVKPDIWVNAYLASWKQGSGTGQLPPSEIDWQAFTHLSYAGLRIKEDGSLTPVKPSESVAIIRQKINQIVPKAHEEGVPILLSLGGWKSQEAFKKATSPGLRSELISNILEMLETHDLDGIDLNIEPIDDSTTVRYTTFVKALRDSLNTIKTPLLSKPLLTAGTIWQPGMFARLHQQFDQINLLTYNFSGPWDGWVVWHNSPLYNGGNTFPGEDNKLPSVNKTVQRYLEEGVPKDKLGIGIDFYGYVWKGEVHAPLQT